MNYRESKLILCANELGVILQLPMPCEDKIRLLINEILVGRGTYSCALNGLITNEETASLLLQHFHSRLFHLESSPALTVHSWQALIDKTVCALFNLEEQNERLK